MTLSTPEEFAAPSAANLTALSSVLDGKDAALALCQGESKRNRAKQIMYGMRASRRHVVLFLELLCSPTGIVCCTWMASSFSAIRSSEIISAVRSSTTRAVCSTGNHSRSVNSFCYRMTC